MSNQNNHSWLWLPTGIACASAAYAALGHPSEYGFYVLARITVTIAAVLLAVYLGKSSKEGMCVACVVTAVVFNPFVPLPLGRGIWVLLDLIAIVFLIVATVQVQQTCPQRSGS